MCPAGRTKGHVVFSFHGPETESKLSGHPCRVELPGLYIVPGLSPPLEIDYS